jgi:hypothetical protein
MPAGTNTTWQPATRVAFRFCFVYFGLYALVTQIAGGVFILPNFAIPALGMVWPLRDLTIWTAVNVFGATPPLIYIGNSGDTVFHWVQTYLVFSTAVVATAAWSAMDRRATTRCTSGSACFSASRWRRKRSITGWRSSFRRSFRRRRW